ncbi:MAG: hypothetical protein WD002_07070 [Pseudomonadales bacterium]
MANDCKKGKTGIFYTKEPAGVVVMQHGIEVYRYKSVQELVDAHVKGMVALEKEMESVLAKAYKPD